MTKRIRSYFARLKLSSAGAIGIIPLIGKKPIFMAFISFLALIPTSFTLLFSIL